MRAYADTNFFTNLFLELTFSADARLLYGRLAAGSHELIPITPLLHLEFITAVQRTVFESRHGSLWRVTPARLTLEQLRTPSWRRDAKMPVRGQGGDTTARRAL